MVRSEYGDYSPNGDSLFQGVMNWAARANRRLLGGMTLVGGGAIVPLLTLGGGGIVVAGACLSVAAIGAWGMIDQHVAHPRSLLVRVLQNALLALGTLAAMFSALGMLFWFMGPAPVL